MKTNSILLVAAFLAMTGSGMAHSQTPLISKPQPTASQTAPADVPSQYVLRHHSGLGTNHPFHGTVILAPKIPNVGPDEAAASDALREQGDAEMKKGNFSAARDDYDQALNIWPNCKPNLYAAAECAAAAADYPRSLGYYRRAIYTDNPFLYGTIPGDGFQENNLTRLMQFALVLDKAGQTAEALFIYNHAAYARDYQDSASRNGEPSLEVLFPEIVTERVLPDQVRYTPEHLQALADTALAREEMSFGSNKEARKHMLAAVKLYPDSAAVQYYLGEALADSYNFTAEYPAQDKLDMTAAYKKAIKLGDDKTAAAAKERLSMYP